MQTRVLKSDLAGTWYSDNPKQLADEIDGYLAAAESPSVNDVMALLLPHAGYRYSGPVAAEGIKQIVGQAYKRVIVIGPSHQVAIMDEVSIPQVSHIETPLGRIELDHELAESLWTHPAFHSHASAHAGEHSVQIELPLLQRALGDFRLLPIVCGQLSESAARQIAEVLLDQVDDETLLVISSDFTHYGKAFGYVPFSDDIPANLDRLDGEAFGFIADKNLGGFLEYIERTGATICGHGPIAILLAMLPPEAEVNLLKYETSGALTGDWSHCVSYVAAAFSGHWTRGCSNGIHCEPELELSESDKIDLLRLARHKIAAALDEDEPALSIEITPAMQDIMGVFVTLHKHGQLRGCIGEIVPRRELYEAVADHALNAAFHDPRFPRVRADELNKINIEISALTVPHRVNSSADIVIGKHGVVLSKNGHSAVFLPQVAPEQGWGVEETLSHLALKAGMGPNDWESGCEFNVFEAIVFSEL